MDDKHDPLLESEINENYRHSTTSLSPSNPTAFPLSGRLAAAHSSDTKYFLTGEYCFAKSNRFLATVGVLTCISVFVWCPLQETEASSSKASVERTAIGFGAHIDLSCLLNGIFQNVKSGRMNESPFKHDLQAALLKAFPTVALRKRAIVHVVGGHELTDKRTNLKKYFPHDKKKQSFARLVQDAVSSIGFENINTSMLLKFKGVEMVQSVEIEQQLREGNMRFVVASLDMHSGRVVTHTKFFPTGYRTTFCYH